MSDAFIGEIRIFPYDFAPLDWLACDGQVYAVAQYQPLYAVIGNAYGGDASRGTFAVPNLSAALPSPLNRAICGVGQAAGGATSWSLGMTNGSPTMTLATNQIPSHTHQMIRSGGNWIASKKLAGPTTGAQVGGLYVNPTTTGETLTSNPPDTTLAPAAIATAGAGAGHENRQPFLVCPFAICAEGTFPVSS